MGGEGVIHDYIIGDDGRGYLPTRYYADKYDMNSWEIVAERKRGLPCVEHDRHYYINEDDFKAYHRGDIGENIKYRGEYRKC